MISLTEEARKELEAYFEGKEKTPIRVYLAPGGCSGPRLALALDEPGEDDETSEDNGLTLCINKELAEKVGAVTVGMTHMGFVVESEIPLPSGGNGGGCSSCCGGCGSSGGGSWVPGASGAAGGCRGILPSGGALRVLFACGAAAVPG